MVHQDKETKATLFHQVSSSGLLMEVTQWLSALVVQEDQYLTPIRKKPQETHTQCMEKMDSEGQMYKVLIKHLQMEI